MEVIAQTTSRIVIDDPSQTAEARRIARKLASGVGLDANTTEQVAIVVTEVCTNILKHAKRGEVLVTLGEVGEHFGIEVLALDRGPGMANVANCMRDGYSTAGSPGHGLGAIARLSGYSDIYSLSGLGTGVLARWGGLSPEMARNQSEKFPIGAVNVIKPGQEICGDSWGVEQNEDEMTVVVADGLGHGPDAHAASIEAIRILHEHPNLRPQELLERIHKALRSSRGAAVAVANVNRADSKVTFAGVGNISAEIYSGSRAVQHLVSVNGTAGQQTQRIHEFNYPWPPNGMLVLHSDGLSTSAGLDGRPGLALCDPAIIAGILYRDFTRGHDDATVVVAKAG
jgi:anti-sigma regulatory factor (Ser/Thr protein kinase)